MIFLCPTSRQIHTITRTSNRIGPHNLDVFSVLVDCLLGDAYGVKNKNKNKNKNTNTNTNRNTNTNIYQVPKLSLNKVVDIKTICFYLNKFIIEDIVQISGL